MKIIDISTPIEEGMVVWPNNPKPSFKRTSSSEKGDLWTETEINIGLHTGTHIDSPLHCVGGGVSVDGLKLGDMVGSVFVAYLPEVKEITADILNALNFSEDTTRLLFRTSNSNFWAKKENKFQKEFVALSSDGAEWLVEHKIKLVGNDYLSIAPFGRDILEVHRILLEKGVIVLEGLDLSEVKQGIYQLICLPLKIVGTEAAPVRAILVR